MFFFFSNFFDFPFSFLNLINKILRFMFFTEF